MPTAAVATAARRDFEFDRRCHEARRRLAAGNLLPNQALDRPQQAALGGVAEGDRRARRAGPGGAADAMDVRLRLHRQVVVEDVGDAVDVEAPGGDVGGDQHRHATAAEAVEGAGALVLRLVAVDRLAVDPRGPQLLQHAVGAVLGLGEHDGTGRVLGSDEVGEQARLVGLADAVDPLLDPLDGRRHRGDLDPHRVAQQLGGEMLDLTRHRRREEHGPTPPRQRRDDPSDRLDEAHVEHPIRLVEDEVTDLAQVHEPLPHQVHEAARRRHDDVEPRRDRLGLRVLADAAEDHGAPQPAAAAIGREALADLGGELTGGREDEHPRSAPGRQGRPGLVALKQGVQQRQRERGGLAGAGLGDAEQIPPGKRRRNRLRLDRRGRLVALRSDRLQEKRVELKRGEARGGGHGGRRNDRHER